MKRSGGMKSAVENNENVKTRRQRIRERNQRSPQTKQCIPKTPEIMPKPVYKTFTIRRNCNINERFKRSLGWYDCSNSKMEQFASR